MAKQNFAMYTPREQHKKRPGVHKKTLNKKEKLNKKLTRYKGGGKR
jgi:hypothetical protein|tara:strand:+ start:609 stop:746 length:138 start_codon:yes stop_codon:yes gene_type:complete